MIQKPSSFTYTPTETTNLNKLRCFCVLGRSSARVHFLPYKQIRNKMKASHSQVTTLWKINNSFSIPMSLHLLRGPLPPSTSHSPILSLAPGYPWIGLHLQNFLSKSEVISTFRRWGSHLIGELKKVKQ